MNIVQKSNGIHINNANTSVFVNGEQIFDCVDHVCGNVIIGDKVIVNGKEVTLNDQDTFNKMVKITVEGAVDNISTLSGDVEIHGNTGPVSTTSGDISCDNVSGSVKTMSGDITCGDIQGSVKSMSGDISYNRKY